jgi:hypothetical protein
MPHDIVMEIVQMAFIKVMKGHFTKLYTKIDNLKMELSTLITMVASIVDENNRLGEVRENVPD